jgi:hypothetical protein
MTTPKVLPWHRYIVVTDHGVYLFCTLEGAERVAKRNGVPVRPVER